MSLKALARRLASLLVASVVMLGGATTAIAGASVGHSVGAVHHAANYIYDTPSAATTLPANLRRDAARAQPGSRRSPAVVRRISGFGVAAKAEVSWVDEAAAMSDDAASYQAGAFGARSNALTRASQAPELNGVRFDGFDRRAGVLIDRKLSVTTFPKSQQQAVRQSEALAAGGYRGRWEVPTTAEAARARRMFGRLGISNIDIAVVPR